jgi:hypothetical protein
MGAFNIHNTRSRKRVGKLFCLQAKIWGERISPDSPVFREQFDIKDLLAARRPKKLTAKYLGDLLNETLQRAGIFAVTHMTEGQKAGRIRNSVPRAHGFRKFFETNLIRSKVQEPISVIYYLYKT